MGEGGRHPCWGLVRCWLRSWGLRSWGLTGWRRSWRLTGWPRSWGLTSWLRSRLPLSRWFCRHGGGLLGGEELALECIHHGGRGRPHDAEGPIQRLVVEECSFVVDELDLLAWCFTYLTHPAQLLVQVAQLVDELVTHGSIPDGDGVVVLVALGDLGVDGEDRTRLILDKLRQRQGSCLPAMGEFNLARGGRTLVEGGALPAACGAKEPARILPIPRVRTTTCLRTPAAGVPSLPPAIVVVVVVVVDGTDVRATAWRTRRRVTIMKAIVEPIVTTIVEAIVVASTSVVALTIQGIVSEVPEHKVKVGKHGHDGMQLGG